MCICLTLALLEFAVGIVHFDEKRRIHKQAASPTIEWLDVVPAGLGAVGLEPGLRGVRGFAVRTPDFARAKIRNLGRAARQSRCGGNTSAEAPTTTETDRSNYAKALKNSQLILCGGSSDFG